MRPGGSSLPLRCRHRHFTLCKEKRLLVLTEHLPWAEPMGACSSGAARRAREGVRDLSHSDSPSLGGSGTGLRALGAALLPSSRQRGCKGDGDGCPPPQLGDVPCRADPRDAQGDVAPAPTHSLPLLLGTAPACPRLLAFPAVPTPGDTGAGFPFFSPHLCPGQQGALHAPPGELGLLQLSITTLNKTCQREQAAATRSLSLLFHTSGSQAGLAALLAERSPVASVSLAKPQGSPGSPRPLLCHYPHVQHRLPCCRIPPPQSP